MGREGAEVVKLHTFLITATDGRGATLWRSWLRHCATSREVAGSIRDAEIDIILPAALWPGLDSASDRKGYQEYFLGGKGGRCLMLTT